MAGTYTNLLYHLYPLIGTDFKDDLYAYIGGIVRGEGGVLLEIGGMPDHVHWLAKFKPVVSISIMPMRIRANSSGWMNEERMKLRKFAWQDGYAASSVSESQLEAVRHDIQPQETHHRGLSHQDEFRALLDRHGVEYDERYLWD